MQEYRHVCVAQGKKGEETNSPLRKNRQGPVYLQTSFPAHQNLECIISSFNLTCSLISKTHYSSISSKSLHYLVNSWRTHTSHPTEWFLFSKINVFKAEAAEPIFFISLETFFSSLSLKLVLEELKNQKSDVNLLGQQSRRRTRNVHQQF